MTVENETKSRRDAARWFYRAALANATLWMLSVVALIFVMQRSPAVGGLFMILAGGTAVGRALVAFAPK